MTTAPPPATPASIDFGRSFTFTSEDPEWVSKILIGGVFVLACSLLVGVPFVLGYFSRTLRNVVAGLARPLPDWDDLGGLFNEGLRLTGVYLLHVLAVIVVALFWAVNIYATFYGTKQAESAAAKLWTKETGVTL